MRILKYSPIIFLIYMLTYTFLYVKGFNLNIENIGQGIYCLISIILGISYILGNKNNPRKDKVKDYVLNLIGCLFLIGIVFIPNIFTYIFYGFILLILIRLCYKDEISFLEFLDNIISPRKRLKDYDYVIGNQVVDKEEYEKYMKDPEAYKAEQEAFYNTIESTVSYTSYEKETPREVIKEVEYREKPIFINNTQTTQKIEIPVIKTKMFTKVEQRSNFVYMEAWEFHNDKKYNNCLSKSVNGILQSWNQNSVTVKDGSWFKTYNIMGAIERTWQF